MQGDILDNFTHHRFIHLFISEIKMNYILIFWLKSTPLQILFHRNNFPSIQGTSVVWDLAVKKATMLPLQMIKCYYKNIQFAVAVPWNQFYKNNRRHLVLGVTSSPLKCVRGICFLYSTQQYYDIFSQLPSVLPFITIHHDSNLIAFNW